MYESKRVGAGTRLQSGIAKRPYQDNGLQANGLLLQGVVIATYVSDSDAHPVEGSVKHPPKAVYCDVLCYPSIAGQRTVKISQALVNQPYAGLHKGQIWKPRATSANILGKLSERVDGANLAYFDGDFVLVGFLNNRIDNPVVLGSLPHPSFDTGDENYESGKRMKLKLVDGDPSFAKHHGVFYGVEDSGDFTVNSTFGNDGSIDSIGHEPLPSTDGSSGNQTYKLPQDSTYKIILYDMSNPVTPIEITSLELDKTELKVTIENGNSITLTDKEVNATLIIGNGAVSATIAETLQTLWGEMQVDFLKHKHPTGTGPSGIPDTALPDWDTAINSTKLQFPNG